MLKSHLKPNQTQSSGQSEEHPANAVLSTALTEYAGQAMHLLGYCLAGHSWLLDTIAVVLALDIVNAIASPLVSPTAAPIAIATTFALALLALEFVPSRCLLAFLWQNGPVVTGDSLLQQSQATIRNRSAGLKGPLTAF